MRSARQRPVRLRVVAEERERHRGAVHLACRSPRFVDPGFGYGPAGACGGDPRLVRRPGPRRRVHEAWETFDDTVAPVLDVPDDESVDATGPDGAIVTYSATATDTWDPAPTVECAPASGEQFPIGTTTVNCTATDDSGNQASGSFDVHVEDASEQIADLVVSIQNAGLGHGVETALEAKLSHPGCAQLQAFETLV